MKRMIRSFLIITMIASLIVVSPVFAMETIKTTNKTLKRYDEAYSIYTKESMFTNKTGVCAAYAAAYQYIMKDKLGFQPPVLSNGTTSAIFHTAGVFNYKAFIWKDDTIKPLSDSKECKLQ